jgi:D-alanyl-D-alanine-carboxypeptidase/D-alanyl-D-alanine-endopeptidase
MKFRYLIFFIILITHSRCDISPKQKLPADIEKETQKRIELGYHLGTVIGIIDKAGTRYYGFGQKSLSDDATPDENSIFEIGSVTKTFTSSLLSDLNQKGEIRIQDSIQTYLPVFKNVLAKNNKIITLENLSTHTSGLPRDPFNMDVNDDYRYRDYSIEKLNNFLSDYMLDSVPNSFNYSNLGVLVIEHAIESKMKKTYESLIIERITNVLGMSDTEFEKHLSGAN